MDASAKYQADIVPPQAAIPAHISRLRDVRDTLNGLVCRVEKFADILGGQQLASDSSKPAGLAAIPDGHSAELSNTVDNIAGLNTRLAIACDRLSGLI